MNKFYTFFVIFMPAVVLVSTDSLIDEQLILSFFIQILNIILLIVLISVIVYILYLLIRKLK